VLFRRRNQPELSERIRLFFLPRRTYGRSFRYFGKRVLRLSGSPHTVAAGFASGVVASCTPFIGFHFLLSFVIAFIARGNMLAAAIGTAVGNPLTFPLIWLADFRIGSWIQSLWQDGPQEELPDGFTEGILSNGWDAIAPVLEPMMIGAVPLALVLGFLSYFAVRASLGSYQRNRRERLAERRDAETTVEAD